MSDEDTMETLLLPPSEQLQQALTQLAETVISHHRDKHTKTGSYVLCRWCLVLVLPIFRGTTEIHVFCTQNIDF